MTQVAHNSGLNYIYSLYLVYTVYTIYTSIHCPVPPYKLLILSIAQFSARSLPSNPTALASLLFFKHRNRSGALLPSGPLHSQKMFPRIIWMICSLTFSGLYSNFTFPMKPYLTTLLKLNSSCTSTPVFTEPFPSFIFFHSICHHVTHSSILAWRIPWIEEPGRLQSMRSHRVRHD